MFLSKGKDALVGEVDYVGARETEATGGAFEAIAYDLARADSEVKEKTVME